MAVTTEDMETTRNLSSGAEKQLENETETTQMSSHRVDQKMEKEENMPMLSLRRERAMKSLSLISLFVCALLFAMQSYMAVRSYQIVNQLNTKTKPPVADIMYQIYFDGNEWLLDAGKVDLRANTSLFVH